MVFYIQLLYLVFIVKVGGSAINFTTSTTTIERAPTTTMETSHYSSRNLNINDCPRACALKIKGINIKMTRSYQPCMKNCVGDWTLSSGGQCVIQASVVESHSNHVCPPINVNVSEIGVFDPVFKKVLGYAFVSWQPCPYGLPDVKGFMVTIQPHKPGTVSECHNVTLTRQLQNEDTQLRFSVLSQVHLIPDLEYTIEIQSLPITTISRQKSTPFQSKSCVAWNGFDKCLCEYKNKYPIWYQWAKNYGATGANYTLESLYPGKMLKVVPQPAVEIQGYSITMTVPQVPSCYHFTSYEPQLAYFVNLNHTRPLSFKTASVQRINYNTQVLQYTFKPIYPSSSGQTYVAWYVAEYVVDGEERYKMSRKTHFQVKDWEPPQPSIETPGNGAIQVKFLAANESYGIQHYEVRLNKHDPKYSSLEAYTTLEEKNISASQIENGSLMVTYYDLQPGVYSAQVREIRPPYQTRRPYFQGLYALAKYGVFKTFKVPDLTAKSHATMGLTLGIPLAVLLTVIVFMVISCLYLWKTGHCGMARSYMPGSMIKWLDSQTVGSFTLRSRTVLLIWQCDLRSIELHEKHADTISIKAIFDRILVARAGINVVAWGDMPLSCVGGASSRHFAAYLRTVCGLNVILDLFEEPQLISGASKWLQTSCERAEFVIFIPPHFNVDGWTNTSRRVVGDFANAFRYLESQIRDKKRYLTALLPYTDIECWETNKFLQNMTRVYKVMDQIEDLYFHIQERSKSNFTGRHKVEHVSKKDYARTKEGRAFRDAVQRFCDTVSQPIEIQDDNTLITEEDILLEADPMSLKRIELVAPEPPICPDHLMQIAPPPPLVVDPDEEIRLINNVDTPPFLYNGEFPSYSQNSSVLLSVGSLENNLALYDPSLNDENSAEIDVNCEPSSIEDSGFETSRI